jgi:hypothetical protein
MTDATDWQPIAAAVATRRGFSCTRDVSAVGQVLPQSHVHVLDRGSILIGVSKSMHRCVNRGRKDTVDVASR